MNAIEERCYSVYNGIREMADESDWNTYINWVQGETTLFITDDKLNFIGVKLVKDVTSTDTVVINTDSSTLTLISDGEEHTITLDEWDGVITVLNEYFKQVYENKLKAKTRRD